MMKQRTSCSGNSQVPWPQGLVRVQERLSAPICACAVWWAAGCWAARAGCLGWATVTAEQQDTCVMARFLQMPCIGQLCTHKLLTQSEQCSSEAQSLLTYAVYTSDEGGIR